MPVSKGSTINSQSQASISAFFAPNQSSASSSARKRSNSPIDLTADSDSEQPPPKKSKTSDRGTNLSHTPSKAEQWRFSSSPLKPQPSSARISDVNKKLHEDFKRKLLVENGPFLRQQNETEEREREGEESLSDESDHAFKELTELFSNKRRAKAKGKGKGGTDSSPGNKGKMDKGTVGPSGQTYTPLEQQVVQLKKIHPGVLLMIEVGYKYKFFGEDAQAAAKELGIVCYPDRNFLVASVPTHRRDVHVKKLLSQGHKVGIVEQIETAALKKVSETRNAPFDRRLTHLYSATTYVDQFDSVDELEKYNPPPLMCLVEECQGGMGLDDRVSIGMVTICPSTGDVVWDEFDDTYMRTELETRLVHTKPAELLLPEKTLSKLTEKMLSNFSGASDNIRVERFPEALSYTEAFSFVADYFSEKKKSSTASEYLKSGVLMAAVSDFPKRVVVALAHAIKHLSTYGIADAFLETKFFSNFTTRAHMLLNANSLTNLEIFQNETDHSSKGSLLWILDHTKTKFGARMLRSWVGRPLVDMTLLQERVDSVEEILLSSSEKLVALRQLLKSLPDLAKGLCRIQYGKCTPQELAVLLRAFNRIAVAFKPVESVGFKSNLLNEIILSLPRLKEPVQELLSIVSLTKMAEGSKDTMWNDPYRHPAIADLDIALQAIATELVDELKSIKKLLKKPSLSWTTAAGEEFLVELNKEEKHAIPPRWMLMSRTKYVERYHTPTVKEILQRRAQCQEAMDAESHKAFLSFLQEISQKYYAIMRDAVNKLATADCLLSFALVALQEGYVRPEFSELDILEIIEGRHPMAEVIRSDPFVPNSIRMGGVEARSKILTGPNMGGKSSAVRMIALIAIMAQIGSYVPAKSVKLGMLDSILTRMGAHDNLVKGKSTFMVEMSETSDILRSATSKSLVILDELGRGTSTFDGMAIADAVLQQLVQSAKCKTLFITHYPLIANELEKRYPQDVQNLHMGYTEETRIDGAREITFLYRLTPGMAKESFGIECARLAGLPESILTVAAVRSEKLQRGVEEKSRRDRTRRVLSYIQVIAATSDSNHAIEALHGLQTFLQVSN